MNCTPLSFFLFFFFFTLTISTQQRYSGNSVLSCNNNDDSGPSPSFLYTCNVNQSSCQAFLIFKSRPHYDSVVSISALMSSEPSELAAINNVSIGTKFPTEKEVIVPVNCFLSSQRNMGKQNRGNRGVLPEDLLVGIASADLVLKVYVHEELKAATNNFDSISRIKGSVYRGVLGGKVVAIKKMNSDLWKEAKILNKINHFNLITLYGVCENNGYSYIVYEYMDNGCLRNWLYNKNHPGVLNCSQRVQIALDAANGIHYLHNFTQPPYVHKDIKSSNVLLDGNLRAKIANLSHATATEISGDGFLSSKFVGTRIFRKWVVVILELITGKCVVTMHEGKETLLSAAIISIMEGENREAELDKILDSSLGVNYRMDLVLEVAKLSAACLKRDPAGRPSMEEVVSTLMKI
ncbi:hypothetical protein ACHQM5_016985 [Ranunculus cassubicifolius]